MVFPPSPDQDPFAGMSPDQIEALARMAAARVQQLGGVAWRGHQAGPQYPEINPMDSDLYKGPYVPTESLSVVAGNIAQELLDRGIRPNTEMVEPNVTLRRKDRGQMGPYIDRRGQRQDRVHRPKDGELVYGNTPAVVRQGWILAYTDKVQEGAYVQGRVSGGVQHTNTFPLKKAGIMLDTEGNVVLFGIPKLPDRPTESYDPPRFNAAGTIEDRKPVDDRAYAAYIRSINPYQPHVLQPGQVQQYHWRNTEGGVFPLDQTGLGVTLEERQANELVDQMTRVGATGQRGLEEIMVDFAASNGIDNPFTPTP